MQNLPGHSRQSLSFVVKLRIKKNCVVAEDKKLRGAQVDPILPLLDPSFRLADHEGHLHYEKN